MRKKILPSTILICLLCGSVLSPPIVSAITDNSVNITKQPVDSDGMGETPIQILAEVESLDVVVKPSNMLIEIAASGSTVGPTSIVIENNSAVPLVVDEATYTPGVWELVNYNKLVTAGFGSKFFYARMENILFYNLTTDIGTSITGQVPTPAIPDPLGTNDQHKGDLVTSIPGLKDFEVPDGQKAKIEISYPRKSPIQLTDISMETAGLFSFVFRLKE